MQRSIRYTVIAFASGALFAVLALAECLALLDLWQRGLGTSPGAVLFICAIWVIIISITLLVALLQARNAYNRARRIQDAIIADNNRTPYYSIIPDTMVHQLALTRGKTLIMVRTLQSQSLLQDIGFYGLWLLVLFGGSALGILAILSKTTLWSLIDWIAVYSPVVAGLSLFALYIVRGLKLHHMQVSIGDPGIAISGTLITPALLPWEAITLFVEIDDDVFWIGDETQGIVIDLQMPTSPTSALFAGLERLVIPSGALQYISQGKPDEKLKRFSQLVATVAVRSNVYLRVDPTQFDARPAPENIGESSGSGHQENPLLLAPVSYQPAASTIAFVQSQGDIHLELRLHRSWKDLLKTVVMIDGGLVIAFLIGVYLETPSTQRSNFFDPLFIFLAVPLTFLLIGLALAPIVASEMARDQRHKLPTIYADHHGITQWWSKKTFIPWEDIVLWAMNKSEESTSGKIRYWVESTTGEIAFWYEIAGAELGGRDVPEDRRTAYRVCAEKLHALIFVYTRLPLSEYVPLSQTAERDSVQRF
jgi:hypothetical protein